MENILEMRGIVKRFGPVVANDGCNLSVRRGEVHALLGENGAGKTTLMNVLYGLYQAEAGEIFFKGQKTAITEPNRAIALGVGMVHQHFMLVPPFTVAENVVLGKEPRRGGGLDRKAAAAMVARLSREYGLTVDPEARVEAISVGQQQRVEVLKALYRGAELLILDEPTAVLTPGEVVELARTLGQLVARGLTVILITHKIKEILHMADRVTVLRAGKDVATLDIRGAATPPSESELARLMVGREVTLTVEKAPPTPGAVVLAVQGLEAKNSRGLPALRGIDLTLRAGEVLGIAGVDGNGQTELVECITGLRRPSAGQVAMHGHDISHLSVAQRSREGIGHIPEDRQRRGLVLDFTVSENIVLGRHTQRQWSRAGFLNYGAILARSAKLTKLFDVRPQDPTLHARSLSGGNQQKAILARELDKGPKLLLAAQPTRGLDVGAIEFIHRRLIKERDAGQAVLLVSFELDEVLALADRIAVMFEGRIVAELPAAEATEERLGLLMAGGGQA